MKEPRNERRRTFFVRTLIMLIILASLLVYTILSQSAQATQSPPGPGPSVANDVGLLITVILSVSIGFWLTFTGKERQGWKKGAWLFIGLICGSAAFLFLDFLFGFGEAGLELWLQVNGYTATIANINMAAWFLFAITIILGIAAFLALFLVVDSLEAAEARDHLQKSR